MAYAFAEIAFTPAVRQQQDRLGSGNYARFLTPERTGGDRLGQAERDFIEARDGFYQASVSQTGWPYVQFRGGPPGFLNVLNDKTIAYADLRGNRQYISLGNLTTNNRIALILVDYTRAQRLKIWGRVQVIEPASEEWRTLPDAVANDQAERVITITIEAFDWNCPQHIPRRFTEGEAMDAIAALETDNRDLRAQLAAKRATIEHKKP